MLLNVEVLNMFKRKQQLGKLLALRTAQIILHDHEQMRQCKNNTVTINEPEKKDDSKIISILPFLRRLCV